MSKDIEDHKIVSISLNGDIIDNFILKPIITVEKFKYYKNEEQYEIEVIVRRTKDLCAYGKYRIEKERREKP